MYSSRLAPGELEDKDRESVRSTQKPLSAVKKEKGQKAKRLVATFKSTNDLQAVMGPLEIL